MSTGTTVATPATAAPPQKKKVLTERARAERKLGWMLCAPAVIVMVAVTAYPIVYAFALSLQRADLRFPAANKFIGLSNYGHVLGAKLWWQDVLHTFIITFFSVGLELILGMGLALIMHRAIFGRGVVRTVALIPYGIVTVVAAFSWRYAWEADSGWIPHLFGLKTDPLAKGTTSYIAIIITEVWKTTPFMSLLLLAGLALVPEDLLKAAQVDGAGAWRRLVKITLPLIKPAILVALLFRTLDAFRIFDNIYVLTGGAGNTESVSILGYDNLFKGFDVGLGSAISVLIFCCVTLIAFLFIKVFGASAPGVDGDGR